MVWKNKFKAVISFVYKLPSKLSGHWTLPVCVSDFAENVCGHVILNKKFSSIRHKKQTFCLHQFMIFPEKSSMIKVWINRIHLCFSHLLPFVDLVQLTTLVKGM